MRFSTVAVVFLALVAAPTLGACKARPAAPADLAAASAPGPEAKAPRNPSDPTATGPMLAYSYSYTIEAPADQVPALSRRQEQVCTAAGPSVCQVLGSDAVAEDGEASGSLKLRATPSWIAGFRGRIDADARAVGGRVASQGVETEDLARSIVDTGAELRAKTLLRDRLEKLLASRPGKLEELLQLEKSLAEVEGEIDAAQSELSAMQARVQMSDLSLNFRAKGGVLGPRATAPLGRAFGGFLAHAIDSAALLVTLLSYLLPMAGAGAVGWVMVRWVRRRRARPTKP